METNKKQTRHLLTTVSFCIRFGQDLEKKKIMFDLQARCINFFCVSVLVSLYEQQEKPTNALEYPSIHATRLSQTVMWLHKLSLGLGGSELSHSNP